MLAIIDYGSGNLRSVAKAFERMADGAMPVIVTNEAEQLARASHIVLPGVGAFADCMAGLRALPSMLDALSEQVLEKKKPFLGICVGMQMLFTRGHEHGVHEGLGWLEGEVKPLDNKSGTLKIPHMGWNALDITQPHGLLAGINSGDHAYFVHSYAAHTAPQNILATCDYAQTITAAVGKDNIMGTQFHPEKSQSAGLALLANFMRL